VNCPLNLNNLCLLCGVRQPGRLHFAYGEKFTQAWRSICVITRCGSLSSHPELGQWLATLGPMRNRAPAQWRHGPDKKLLTFEGAQLFDNFGNGVAGIPPIGNPRCVMAPPE
jgi:hypothetical protein